MKNHKAKRRQRIRWQIRKKISGTADRPRLAVFRSNIDIYAQLIDDKEGITLASATSRDSNVKGMKGTKIEKAKEVGKMLAKMAKEKGITSVIFDRGGFLYHGRVKSLAEGAREGGLKI